MYYPYMSINLPNGSSRQKTYREAEKIREKEKVNVYGQLVLLMNLTIKLP